MWYSQAQLWSCLGTMWPQFQILRWHCQRQNRSNNSNLGKTLRWFCSDAKWPVDPLRTLARDGLPQTDAGYTYPLLSIPLWRDGFSCLPAMRKDHGTGVAALLRPLWAVPWLESCYCLLPLFKTSINAVSLAKIKRHGIPAVWKLFSVPFWLTYRRYSVPFIYVIISHFSGFVHCLQIDIQHRNLVPQKGIAHFCGSVLLLGVEPWKFL